MTNQTRPAQDHLLSIHDAVRRGTTEKSLFDAASNGEIELLFEIHATMPPVLLAANAGINPSVGVPNPMRTPTHLVVETALCKRFKERSSLRVQKASRGYLKGSGSSVLRCLDASAADDAAMPVFVDGAESPPPEGERYSRWGFWGFHVDGTPRDHPVTKDELLVQASKLDDWIAREIGKASGVWVPQTSATANGGKAYLSEQLMRMCQAAETFWNDKHVIQGERETYPPKESVIAWFMKCGFEQTPAESAAKLIAPEWAEFRGRPSK